MNRLLYSPCLQPRYRSVVDLDSYFCNTQHEHLSGMEASTSTVWKFPNEKPRKVRTRAHLSSSLVRANTHGNFGERIEDELLLEIAYRNPQQGLDFPREGVGAWESGACTQILYIVRSIWPEYGVYGPSTEYGVSLGGPRILHSALEDSTLLVIFPLPYPFRNQPRLIR